MRRTAPLPRDETGLCFFAAARDRPTQQVAQFFGGSVRSLHAHKPPPRAASSVCRKTRIRTTQLVVPTNATRKGALQRQQQVPAHAPDSQRWATVLVCISARWSVQWLRKRRNDQATNTQGAPISSFCSTLRRPHPPSIPSPETTHVALQTGVETCRASSLYARPP